MLPAPTRRFYHAVPPQQVEVLRHFRATHPYYSVVIDRTRWDYIDTGSGEHTLLILVGGLRVADGAFPAISALESSFRIIAPTYPPLYHIAALTDGVAGVLDAAQVKTAHVLAGSFGGMVAQVFMQRHAARIDKLALSSTGIPRDIRAYRRTARRLRFTPSFLARRIGARRLFKIMAPPPEQSAFWWAFIRELFLARLGKADLLSTFRCVIDFVEQAQVQVSPTWPGPVLLIGAQDDQTFDENARMAVQSRYPQAQVHTFAQAGHSPSMTHPAEYFGVVRDFLRA